jgi:hypothetical protein
VFGNQTTQGQLAAKRAAANEAKGRGLDPETLFFAAVPASSFVPEKAVVTIVITFQSDDGTDGPDEEEEVEDAAEDGQEVPSSEPVEVPSTEPEPLATRQVDGISGTGRLA